MAFSSHDYAKEYCTVYCFIVLFQKSLSSIFIFIKKQENTVIVNRVRYIDKLNIFLKQELLKRMRTMNQLNVWFQKDRAPPLTATATMNVVRTIISGHHILRFEDIH